MPAPPFFAHSSRFSLQTTRRDLLFRVSISERCALSLSALLLLALIGASSGSQKAFLGIVDPVLEDVLFPIPFRAR